VRNKKLGVAIPFTKRWFIEKKLKRLVGKASEIAEKASRLQEEVAEAKQNAYRLFSASEYDRVSSEINDALENICEAVQEDREPGRPARERAKPPKEHVGKKCRQALGIQPEGRIPLDKLAEWKLCVARGGPNGYKPPASPTASESPQD